MDITPTNAVVFKPKSQVSFEITALIQEWHDFLLAQCGYEEADHELIARLAARNAHAFGTVLWDEASVLWNPVEGHFSVPARIYFANGQRPPLTLEQLDLIWSDCFDETSNDWFEGIESDLYAEREHQLLS